MEKDDDGQETVKDEHDDSSLFSIEVPFEKLISTFVILIGKFDDGWGMLSASVSVTEVSMAFSSTLSTRSSWQ